MTSQKNMQPYKVDKKFLEILVNLVREQNEQLLSAIAEDKEINKRHLQRFLPSKFELKEMLLALK